jgi:drug/metabolite transporter (DMT)-like permease
MLGCSGKLAGCARRAQEIVMPSKSRYWFPAKRYGWGWRLPVAWQGWLVLGGYLGLVAAGVIFFPPHRAPAAFVALVIVLSALLTGLCWLKGEPPRWRWGDDDRAD